MSPETLNPEYVRGAVELWERYGATLDLIEDMTYNQRVQLFGAAREWLAGSEIRWCAEHKFQISDNATACLKSPFYQKACRNVVPARLVGLEEAVR